MKSVKFYNVVFVVETEETKSVTGKVKLCEGINKSVEQLIV